MCQIPKLSLLRFQLDVELKKAKQEIERCHTLLHFFDSLDDEELTEGLIEAQNAILQFYSIYERELTELIGLMDARQ